MSDTGSVNLILGFNFTVICFIGSRLKTREGKGMVVENLWVKTLVMMLNEAAMQR